MAIEMARQVRPKTQDPRLLSLIETIENTQQEEITQMRSLLDERHVPENIMSLFY